MGVRRSSSTDAGPSASPTTLTRASSTYPPESYDTPTQLHRRPLGRVDESPTASTSTGHRVPLAARDYADGDAGSGSGGYYAASPASMTNTHRSSIATMTSNSELDGTTSSWTKTASIPPDPDPEARRARVDTVNEPRVDLVPPVSVHDTYLSKHITPLVPESTSRPSVPRSTSVPAVQGVNEPKPIPGGGGVGLLPPIDVGADSVGKPNPIFEIFDAAPGEGSKKLERRLRGHLKDVLKVQEEIGKMHLALEGLGLGDMGAEALDEEDGTKGENGGDSQKESVEDSLSRREKGVEALMEKLGVLSETLRTYHDLGTPRLQFPSDHKRSHTEIPLDDDALSSSPPPLNRQQSAYPAIGGQTTLHAEPAGLNSPPPRHKGIDDLIRSEGGAGSGADKSRKSSNNSDLPPLRLPVDDYDYSAGGLRKKPSASFMDLEALRREDRDSRHEQTRTGLETSGRRSGSVERRHFDYAIREPVDRSRAW